MRAGQPLHQFGIPGLFSHSARQAAPRGSTEACNRAAPPLGLSITPKFCTALRHRAWDPLRSLGHPVPCSHCAGRFAGCRALAAPPASPHMCESFTAGPAELSQLGSPVFCCQTLLFAALAGLARLPVRSPWSPALPRRAGPGRQVIHVRPSGSVSGRTRGWEVRGGCPQLAGGLWQLRSCKKKIKKKRTPPGDTFKGSAEDSALPVINREHQSRRDSAIGKSNTHRSGNSRN